MRLQQWSRLTGGFLLTAILAGCAVTPDKLGISPQQWQSMNESQKQKLLNDYHEAHQNLEAKAKRTVYKGPEIVVYLSGGKAMMPPFTEAYSFRPIQFEMKPGECHNLPLFSVDDAHHVQLSACYNGLTLILDPSRYATSENDGSLRFNYNPLWKRGFSYNGVSSSGYARLSKVSVTINTMGSFKPKSIPTKVVNTRIEKMAPVVDVNSTRP